MIQDNVHVLELSVSVMGSTLLFHPSTNATGRQRNVVDILTAAQDRYLQ